MLARMRDKPGGASIPVTVGDFTTVPVDGQFALVYIVFSTLYGLPTQDAQGTCIRHVVEHLAPGGVFVVEGFVPNPLRFDNNQRVQVNRIEPGASTQDTSTTGRGSARGSGGRKTVLRTRSRSAYAWRASSI
jgi:hypothetical protein